MNEQIPMDVYLCRPLEYRHLGDGVFTVYLVEGRDDNGQAWRCYESGFHADNRMLHSKRYGYCKVGEHEVHS